MYLAFHTLGQQDMENICLCEGMASHLCDESISHTLSINLLRIGSVLHFTHQNDL